MDVRGAIAVVTGAGSGIGRATALLLARRGARVHVVDMDADRAEAVAREIREAGGQAVAHAVDVADPVAVERLAEEVRAAGAASVLVNNAGICFVGLVAATSLDDWRRVVDVNLWGVVHGVHFFLPQMIAVGQGHIVNVASISGLLGLPAIAAYSASKHAVVGLSESLSAELAASGIRVTAVCPAAVRTRVLDGGAVTLPGGLGQAVLSAVDRHAVEPERIARDIVRIVERPRDLFVRAGWARMLWHLKRLAPRAYHALARALARRLLARFGRPDVAAPRASEV